MLNKTAHTFVICIYLCIMFAWNGHTTEIRFVDVTEEAGIHFKHVGGIDRRVVPALVGSGAAWRDYDNNGTLDLYLVNSSDVRPEPGTILPKNRLFSNNGDGTFTDVTDIAGVGDTGWGMGCAFADYDNDGDADLYVTNYKANVFYLNLGDGTFKLYTSGAGGIGHTGFGSGIVWGDFDVDGYLELYLGNYIEYSKVPQGDEVFFPYDFFGQANVLYLNKADGSFIDVTDASKVNGGFHLTLGVAAADYDSDGDLDIYLANDSDQNILYRNDGEMTFTNTNQPDARSRTGDIRSGMGIAWGDYDNDGSLDLFVTNWLDENNVLYRNNGDGTFTDVSAQSGVFESGLGKTCWGTVFFDMDNDTDLDLFFAAGHIDPASWENHGQSDVLLRNNGDGTFTDVSEQAGLRQLESPGVGRGVAAGDYDADGDIDLLIVNAGEKPRLLRNDGGNRLNWLHIRTVGVESNRDGIGAQIKVVTGEIHQIREVTAGSSYLSQNSPEVEFGLGKHNKVDKVIIQWTSGTLQTLTNIKANQRLIVTEKVE
ncbi:MAG: CRTAC1 family protein [Candidatus Poribacteria bacterium]|nr:CRTAC1 family protein [Candidatus Poribacteria bacterium]